MTTPPHGLPPHISFSFQDIPTTSDTVAMTMSATRTPPGTGSLHPSSSGNEATETNVRRRDKVVQGSKRGTQRQHAIKWTAALTRHFLQAIVNYFKGKGRTPGRLSHPAWIKVQNAFWKNTDVYLNNKEARRQYNVLKSEWMAWVLIKGDKSVAGAGWNPKKGLVEGPDDDSWEKMTACNPEIAKFRNKSLDHEDLMERVYQEVTASENEAYAPGDSNRDYGGANGSEESDGMNSDRTMQGLENTFVTPPSKGKAKSDPNSLMLGGCKRGSQNRQPATAAKWTPTFTEHFLKAIVNEFEENGRDTGGLSHSAWIRVQNAIRDETIECVDKEELVKKYNILKSEWRAWVLLTEDKSVSGAGWNPEKGIVEGPGYWWDMMKARNPIIAKFRDKPLDHVDLMECVYRKVTATGSEAYAAGDSDSDYDGANGSEESDGMNSDGTRPATKTLLCLRFGRVRRHPTQID